MENKFQKMLEQASDLAEDQEYEEALLLYDKILNSDQKNIPALIDKADTFQIYNAVLNEDSKNLDALIGKGTLLHAKSKFLDAVECYDLALKIKPRFAMALACKGMSLGEIGELTSALSCFKKALIIDKDYDLANLGKQKALELLKSQKSKK